MHGSLHIILSYEPLSFVPCDNPLIYVTVHRASDLLKMNWRVGARSKDYHGSFRNIVELLESLPSQYTYP